MIRASLLIAAVSVASAFTGPAGLLLGRSCTAEPARTALGGVQMINLFGNTEESSLRRKDLSLRQAPPGSRKVTFRKPNAATQGIMLGLKFRENFAKRVFIDKIVPNTEAARLEREGKLKVGDEITMVSATFGDEMWSSRGVGKYRLEKSIAVRQGMTISFVVESPDDNSKKAMKELQKKKDAESA